MKKDMIDSMASTLKAYGVERIYCCPTAEMSTLTDRLSTIFQVIKVAHEECGGFAAGADAQFSELPAVCIGGYGSGTLRWLNGLYDAHRNQSPVLLIALEDIETSQGVEKPNSINIEKVFSTCSYLCKRAKEPQEVLPLIHQALLKIKTTKGVVVLSIPRDFIDETIEWKEQTPIEVSPLNICPSDKEIQEIKTLVDNSKRILIFGGKGCRGAHDQVMQLARKLKAPVGWAYRGKDILDYDNPYPVGMNGLLGDKSCLLAMHHCDLLILLGTDFAFSNFYPNHAKIIQIDINGANIGRRHWIDLGVVGDTKQTLEKLLPQLETRADDTFALKCTKAYADVENHLVKISHQNADSKHHIYPEYLSYQINEIAKDDAFVVADIGSPWAYMAKYIESKGKRRLYHSCMHGTMANCLSDCIGIQTAFPQSQVVAMCGDGGFTMLMGDLVTVKKNNLPIKIVVYNNRRLDFVALEMKTSGLIDYGTDLIDTDFAALAASIGIKNYRIDTPDKLKETLQEAFSQEGPVVIDVNVNPNSLLMPPVITTEMAQKFSTYLWKAFVSGEDKTLLEMFEVNFPRQL